MKMNKTEEKNIMHKLHTFLKNRQIFYKKMLHSGQLFRDLDELCKKWHKKSLKETTKSVCDLKLFFEYETALEDIYQKLWYQLTQDSRSEMKRLLKKHDLGYEWMKPLLLYIASGHLLMPVCNFNLTIKKDDNKEKKRVILELNPDTSIDDIVLAWPQIQKKQREFWPKFKRTNFSPKLSKQMKIFLEDWEQRRLSFQGKKMTDLDIIGRIKPNDPNGCSATDFSDLSTAKDKKDVANLRQIRHRFKRRA